MSDELTPEQWREAFRRVCIMADWRDLNRPTGLGADGVDWCSDAPLFDVDANARAVLDDDVVRAWNECLSSYFESMLFR